MRRHKEMTSGFLHGNMLLPKLGAGRRCGGGGECSLEHTVQTAVVDLVG